MWEPYTWRLCSTAPYKATNVWAGWSDGVGLLQLTLISRIENGQTCTQKIS